MNEQLAQCREQSRVALPADFHIVLDDMFHRGVLQRCYTQSFDGLEGRLTPEMLAETTGPVVVQAFGNNDKIRCEMCAEIFPADTFHADHLNGVSADCPVCASSAGELVLA